MRDVPMRRRASWSRLWRVVGGSAVLSTLAVAASGAQKKPSLAAKASASAVTVTPDALHFLVMGDWGRNGEPEQRAVARSMAKVAEKLGVEFIINTGDNIYPAGVASVDDPQWQSSFENVYTAHALQVDWFSVLGNHDYRGNPEAQVLYTNKSRRWRLPARNYAVHQKLADGTTADFLFIDTSPLVRDYWKDLDKYHLRGTDSLTPVRWLDSTLKASTATWKFVVGHHHVYSGGKRTTQPELHEKIRPLLEKYGVQAWFNGHEHDLQHIVPPGSPVEYFVSGAGSEHRPTGKTVGTRFEASVLGFMTGSLTRTGLLVQAVDTAGRVLYRTTVPVSH